MFLQVLEDTANVRAACRAIDISRCTMYEHRKRDDAFRLEWDHAIEAATDELEAEARRRAKDGVPEPVFYQGEQVATVQRYSDMLMSILLRGHRPERYNRERHEISGPEGGPLASHATHELDLEKILRRATPEARQKLREFLQELGAGEEA